MRPLDVLLDRIIDYAGMFPPADLPFEEMLRHAAALPKTLHRPHLIGSDIVVKPDRLAAIADDSLVSAGFEAGRRVRVCLVGVPLSGGAEQITAIKRFRRQAQDATVQRRVVSLEVVVDDDLARPEDIDSLADRVATLQDAAAEENVALYVEPQWSESAWGERMSRAAGLFSRLNESGGDVPVGLKVRCAGPTALGPPTLARIVPFVNEFEIPFKTTQGLHHPVVETKRYGNVVGFVGLAAALRLHDVLEDEFPHEAIAGCIGEDDAKAFRLDDGLGWRSYQIDETELERAMGLPFSVGSCSASEPDQDLVRLFGA